MWRPAEHICGDECQSDLGGPQHDKLPVQAAGKVSKDGDEVRDIDTTADKAVAPDPGEPILADRDQDHG